MKPRIFHGVIRLGVIGLSFFSAGAYAEMSRLGLYVNGAIGQSQYDYFSDFHDDGSFLDEVDTFEDSDFAVKLSTGIELFEGVSIEASYVDFGSAEIKGIEYSGSTEVYIYDDSDQMTALGVALRADYWVQPGVNMYASIGAAKWEIEAKTTYKLIDNDVLIYNDTRTGQVDEVDPFLTFGFGIYITDRLSLIGEYIYIDASFKGVDVSVSGLFAGLQYTFDSRQSFSWSRVPAGSKRKDAGYKRTITACDPEFKDISGLVCDEE